MSTLREAFEEVLADWTAQRGVPECSAAFHAHGEVSLLLGDVVGTLVYRAETDTLVLWFESGSVEAPTCFREMLGNQDRYALTRGFSYAYAPRTGRVIVQDRRPAERVDSAAALDAWLSAGSVLAAATYEMVRVGPAALPKEV